jgi:hypothetical protein
MTAMPSDVFMLTTATSCRLPTQLSRHNDDRNRSPSHADGMHVLSINNDIPGMNISNIYILKFKLVHRP